MTDEIRYVFTEKEFREIYKDIFALGMKVDELNLDPEQVELCCDRWLEVNGSDFQLENVEYERTHAPRPLSEVLHDAANVQRAEFSYPSLEEEHNTDLRDDIETDLDHDQE